MTRCQYRDLFSECGEQSTQVVQHEMRYGGTQHLCDEHAETMNHIIKREANTPACMK